MRVTLGMGSGETPIEILVVYDELDRAVVLEDVSGLKELFSNISISRYALDLYFSINSLVRKYGIRNIDWVLVDDLSIANKAVNSILFLIRPIWGLAVFN